MVHLISREGLHLIEDHAAYVGAGPHRHLRRVVHRHDCDHAQHQGDGEHECTSGPDVVHVPFDDPVVDDVGVKGRQIKVAERLGRQQRHHRRSHAGVWAQIGPEQAN